MRLLLAAALAATLTAQVDTGAVAGHVLNRAALAYQYESPALPPDDSWPPRSSTATTSPGCRLEYRNRWPISAHSVPPVAVLRGAASGTRGGVAPRRVSRPALISARTPRASGVTKAARGPPARSKSPRVTDSGPGQERRHSSRTSAQGPADGGSLGFRIWKPAKLFHDFRRTGVRNLIQADVPQHVAMRILATRQTASSSAARW